MAANDHIHTLARGVIAAEKHILLAHCKGGLNTFLPGGHVGAHEGLKEALCRELTEELGLVSQTGDYLGIVEHHWREGERFQHEINHVFAASLADVKSPQPVVSRETHLEFFWAPVADLARHDLRPSPLVELIRFHLGSNQSAFFASTFASSTSGDGRTTSSNVRDGASSSDSRRSPPNTSLERSRDR